MSLVPKVLSKALIIIRVVVVCFVCAALFYGGVQFEKRLSGGSLLPAIISGESIVMRTKGGLLEVSKIISNQQITQVFPGYFFNTIVTVTVPTTYRYHIELEKDWKFLRQGSTFVAVAPKIMPTLPTAFDTEGMAVTASLPFSESAKISVLKQVTPLLTQRAIANLPRQREHARATISEFVKKWVLEQDKFKGGKGLKVLVLFPDEPIDDILKNGLYPIPIPK